ncbi:MAG: chemotaxis protein CheW [Chloroflexota bacterium]
MVEQHKWVTQGAEFNRHFEERPSKQQVEVILVKVAHQPFGLLMSQVYNIVRPDNGEVTLRQHHTKGQTWREIEYRGEFLKIVELDRILYLSQGEPLELEYRQILLSGRIHPSGLMVEPFGVLCDEILVITSISTDDLRPIPGWLFKKRLGKLIWGAALLKPEVLVEKYDLQGLSDNVLDGKGSNLTHQNFPVFATPPSVGQPKGSTTSLLHTAQSNQDERRPVMLLDLEILHRRIYNN